MFQVVKAGGAGHKVLMVALGLADCYVNTGPSTFKWDTCAPHALLMADGGNIVDCKQFVDVTYNGREKANIDGIIAFREKIFLHSVKDALSCRQ